MPTLGINLGSKEPEPGFLEEIVNFESGAGNVQDEPGSSCHARKQKICKRLMEVISKLIDANLKGLLLA